MRPSASTNTGDADASADVLDASSGSTVRRSAIADWPNAAAMRRRVRRSAPGCPANRSRTAAWARRVGGTAVPIPMIEAAAANGWIDRNRAIAETLTSIRRAGAQIVLTYWAAEATHWLK